MKRTKLHGGRVTEDQEVLSRFHEAIVELVSQHPDWALPFLRRLPLSFVSEGDLVTADNANLGTARPPELAADCLLRVVRNGKTVLVIVVEVEKPGAGFVQPCCSPRHSEQVRSQMRHPWNHGGITVCEQRPQDMARFVARRN